MPSRRHVLGVALLAVVLLPTVLGTVAPFVVPAAARPPPEPLCGTCTLDEDTYGIGTVRVDHADSSLAVELLANGSSRWTERVELTDGADELAAKETVRAAVLDRAFHRHVVDERVGTRARVVNDTLVTTYRVRGLGTCSAGVLTVDLFDRTDREAGVFVGANRATLVGLPGFLAGRRLAPAPTERA